MCHYYDLPGLDLVSNSLVAFWAIPIVTCCSETWLLLSNLTRHTRDGYQATPSEGEGAARMPIRQSP
ncbi:uncharacterized protein BO96DRAFT_416818 [Aspergillus niger CBS 101883]|uniref:uncharacterized protein n=1 Tax=Aspergillus lacticoffeatus (strain CBS 101883) TaxID=1450533 RepID=UPI000D7F7B6E|nr:uncharacterized protein BO96DRAFT_416818 [Aspergillus niger CBS 101883]PYH50826.1 hypothetical protein BO96DRAFT_416818 [Aspergillus niger CBS 101883]